MYRVYDHHDDSEVAEVPQIVEGVITHEGEGNGSIFWEDLWKYWYEVNELLIFIYVSERSQNDDGSWK